MALSASAGWCPGGHSAAAMAARPQEPPRGGYASWQPSSGGADEAVMALSASAGLRPGGHPAAAAAMASAPLPDWNDRRAATDPPIGRKQPRPHTACLLQPTDIRSVNEGRGKLRRTESVEQDGVDDTGGEPHHTDLMATQSRTPHVAREHYVAGFSTQPRLRSLMDSALASSTVAKLRKAMGDGESAGPRAQLQGTMQRPQRLTAASGASGDEGARGCVGSVIVRSTCADTIPSTPVDSPGGSVRSSWKAWRGARMRDGAWKQPAETIPGTHAVTAGGSAVAGSRRVHDGEARSRHQRELPTFQLPQHFPPQDPAGRTARITVSATYEQAPTHASAGTRATASSRNHGKSMGENETTALAFSRAYARVYIPCRAAQGHDSAGAHRIELMLANLETKLALLADSTARLPHAAAYAVSTICDLAASPSLAPSPRHSVNALDAAINLAVPPIAFEIRKALRVTAGGLDGVAACGSATAFDADGSAPSSLAASYAAANCAPHARAASTGDATCHRGEARTLVRGAGPSCGATRPAQSARPRPGGEVFWLEGLRTLTHGRGAVGSAGDADAGVAAASPSRAVPGTTSSMERRL